MTGGMRGARSGYGGVAWVLLYVLFTAVQGVWLGSFLQRVDFFATVFVYFALTMIFFLALFVLHGKSIVALVRACGWKDIAVLNILTCASWLSYFAAIKYIEPAVEAAIGSAVPVITTLIILYAQGNRNFNRHNLISAAVIFVGGSVLVYASLAGMSAIGAQETSRIVVGVLMAVITGVAIAAYMLFSKKLYRKKITAQEIMVLRFPLLLIVSAVLAPSGAIAATVQSNWQIVPLITAVGVILPIFCLQLGIERRNPLTVSVLITTIPIFFYVVQFLDARLAQSLPSIVGVAVVIVGVLYGLLWGKKN